MDTTDFFVKSIPYFAHQYDEEDLILYTEYDSDIEDIWIQRNSRLENDTLCHDLYFENGLLSEKFNAVLNLELYDNFDNEQQYQHWFQLQNNNAFSIPLISGVHILLNGENYNMNKLNLTSLLNLKIQGLPLQKYLSKKCQSGVKRQVLHQKYPNFCSIPPDTPEYFSLADKYIMDNIVILSM